jgi:peptidoglycan hydrolase-like protein with peptidoglycan-binding domain
MLMNANNEQSGTENCANLMSLNQATGQLVPIKSDCVTIFNPAPSVPVLDVVKTCGTAAQNGSVWNVDCTITVSGQNLPAGEVIRVMDELNSAGSNNAQSGILSPNGSTYSQCGGGAINNGIASGCDIFVDDLVANGGTIVFDFSGTISGPGGIGLGNGAGQISGYPENCAYADIAGAGVHGPDNATGKSCMDIPLELSLVPHNPTGPIITGTATPVDPDQTGDVEECSTDILFVVDQSSSMNQHNRLGKTRLAIQQAMNVFQGNGSAASLVTFSNQAQIVIAPAEVIPSGNMLSAVLGLSGVGQTNWAEGLAKARNVVAAATKKPLVLFITDGGPNRPPGPDQWGLPPVEVAAIRAMGSRVIGIGLNQSFIQSALVPVFGPNVINVGTGDTVDPFANDGIIIPNNVDYADVFGQIAAALCPTSGAAKSAGTIIDLKMPAPPYSGDDEPTGETTGETTGVQTPTPELHLVKEAVNHCVANRDTQKYDCGFRLTITNIGQTRHTGPVVISDDFGKPAPRSALVTSSGGWTCDKPRAGSMGCINRNLDLQPGQSSMIEMSLKIPGLRDGGRFRNCAGIGVGDNRVQRVALIQEIMNQRGLNAGPVDGKPGNKTYAALAQLQDQLGLPRSREFDDALFKSSPVQKSRE